MPLTRLSAIDGEAILPLADAKAHLRVLSDDEDDLIGSLRDAAIDQVERLAGIALGSGQWEWTLRSFPSRIDLPIGPVTVLTSIKYLDGDRVEQDYADARLVGSSVFAATASAWPVAFDQVKVEFTAGLASSDEEPGLLAAVKLQLQLLWQRGGMAAADVQAMENAVQALIGTRRAVLV